MSLAPAELFLEPLQQEVAQIAFQPFAKCYDIQVAGLGEMVVVQGSLALARQCFGHHSENTSRNAPSI